MTSAVRDWWFPFFFCVSVRHGVSKEITFSFRRVVELNNWSQTVQKVVDRFFSSSPFCFLRSFVWTYRKRDHILTEHLSKSQRSTLSTEKRSKHDTFVTTVINTVTLMFDQVTGRTHCHKKSTYKTFYFSDVNVK